METGFVRKPRQHFDTAPRPQHVTFDDGRGQRRNFPWMRYAEARWDYDMEPDVIHVLIADWLVVIRGIISVRSISRSRIRCSRASARSRNSKRKANAGLTPSRPRYVLRAR